MLQNIRDNSQGLVAKIIIGFVIITFALFGAEAIFQNIASSNDVATVDGEEITESRLQQAMFLQKRQMLSQMGENADPSLIDDNMVREPALKSLIDQTVLLNEARESEIVASQTYINQQITENPSFQENGQFSPELYQSLLRSSGFSPKMYMQLLKDELTIKQLSAGIASSAFITERELEATHALLQQKRDVAYITLSKSDYEKGIDVTDAEAEAYYNDNEQKYYTKESVEAEYIELKLSDFYQPVETDLVKEQYDADLAAFEPVVEKRVSHIMLELNDDSNKQEAIDTLNNLKTKISSPEEFASLAKTESEDLGSKEMGGDLGFTKGDTFPESFETAIVDLKKGEISAPFETDQGVHIVMVTELTETEFDSFDVASKRIEERIQRQQAEPLYLEAIEQLGDLTYTSNGLEDAAQALSLKVATTAPIQRQAPSGIATDPKVMKALYSDDVLKEKNNSQVIELSDTDAIVVRVGKHNLPKLKALAEVKDDVVIQVKTAKAQEQMKAKIDSLMSEVKAGKSLASLAKAASLSYESKVGVKRQGGDLSFELQQAAFELPDPGAGVTMIDSVTLANGDMKLFTVSNVSSSSSDEDKLQQQAMKQFIAQSIGMETFAAYKAFLDEKADIEIRQ